MSAPVGRERPWDLEINGYPFKAARDKNGKPAWRVSRTPDIAGHDASIQDRERAYASAHGGFGWSQYLAPNTYHYGVSYDGRYPGQGIVGPLVTSVAQTSKNATVGVTGFFEYGSYLYTLSGRYCNRIDPSNDTVASAGGFPYDFGAGTVATMGLRFDANVLIGFAGTTENVKFDGTNFSQDDDSLQGDYFAKFWAETQGDALAQTFLSGANPSVAWLAQAAEPFTAANWAGADGSYNIGDAGGTITGLAAFERTLFIGKTDGLYVLDGASSRTPCAVPAQPRDSANGTNMIADSLGRIWYPAKSGLYLYDAANLTVDDVLPGRGLANRSGIHGIVSAIAHFRAWTYVSVYDGTDTYIMAGRQREEGEPGFGPYIWHGALAKIASTKVTSMHISSLVSPPRLWLGLLSGNVAYIKLPSNGDNPLNDSTCFVEETSVRAMSGIRGASRRWYEGEVVEITTAQGHKLTGTPNHPILTSAGWKALGLLAEGDDVISCGGAEKVHLAGDDPDNMDASIGEVFRLLNVLGAPLQVAGSNQQFHGDGQKSQVDIVLADSLLWDGIQAALAKPSSECRFAATDLNHGPLANESLLVKILSRTPTTLVASMGAREHSAPLVHTHPSDANQVSLTPISDNNPFPNEDVPQYGGVHPDGSSDALTRLPILDVSADQLLDVVRRLRAAEGIGLAPAANVDSSADKARSQKVGSKPHGLSDSGEGFLAVNVAGDQGIEVARGALPHQLRGLTTPADRDTRLDELAPQDPVANPNRLGDNRQTLPFQISRDKIVKIERRHFAGHVYNLQTNNEWYIANSIIAHNCRYAASASIYYPADDYGIPGMRWNLSGAVLEAEGLSANTTMQIYERRDVGSWVSLQTVSSSGRTVILPTGDKRFTRCELRVDVVNADSTSTPVLRVLAGRASRRPTQYDLIETTVIVSKEILSRMGIESRYSANDLITQLDTLDNYYPITVRDWWTGVSRDQTVLVMPITKDVIEQEGNKEVAMAVSLVMRKIA